MASVIILEEAAYTRDKEMRRPYLAENKRRADQVRFINLTRGEVSRSFECRECTDRIDCLLLHWFEFIGASNEPGWSDADTVVTDHDAYVVCRAAPHVVIRRTNNNRWITTDEDGTMVLIRFTFDNDTQTFKSKRDVVRQCTPRTQH